MPTTSMNSCCERMRWRRWGRWATPGAARTCWSRYASSNENHSMRLLTSTQVLWMIWAISGVAFRRRLKGLWVGRTLAYSIILEEDDGALLATSPDFPELTTFGDDREEAVTRAVEALEEAIASRIHDRRDIPSPSRGAANSVLPTLISVKVMLYQGMKDQGITKTELARRLGWHLPQVDRVLDVQHRSWLDQIDAALGAIGQQLHVSAAASPGSAVPAVRGYEAIDAAGTGTETRNGHGDSGEGIDRK